MGILSATWRFTTPSARSASHTTAMPPRPSSRISRYPASTMPSISSGGGFDVHLRQPVDDGPREYAGLIGRQRRCQQALDARAQRRIGGGQFA